jgi:hypothetical protein
MDEMRVSPISERARRLAARIKERYDSQEFQAFWVPAKRGILANESDP